jgi:hypothetical protein
MDALLITVHLVVDIAWTRKGLTQIQTSKGRNGISVLPVSHCVILCHNCVGAVAYVETKA